LSKYRSVSHVVTAHQQREGAGFIVRRPLPTAELKAFDPFLMIDEVGPVHYGRGEALGAPDHPHRGFETVSYIISGEKLHEDSTGKTQLICAGDVQWMTAGAGIVHSEMPSAKMLNEGGVAHGFQIWVNLPAAHKFAEPGYQYRAQQDIPLAASPDGKVEVSVIAGQAFGVQSSIGTRTPIWLQDWRAKPGCDVTIDIDSQCSAALYVFDGNVEVGVEQVTVARGQLAVLGTGTTIQVTTNQVGTGGRFLLLAGQPIDEPVARHGPFVMNTESEIVQAMHDFRSGRMGSIERP
jgi:quercetin 2,3-dioxygenase